MDLTIVANRPRRFAVVALLPILGGALIALAAVQTLSGPPAKPTTANKCPVCGMFVAGYKDFLAAVVFADGAVAYFDGCKDMFRFLFDLKTYAPGRQRADVASVWVTDYYSLGWIDGTAALFVRGSDVLGPMGRELIPFAKEAEAKEFLKDHHGDALFRFANITADVIKDID